MSAIPVSEHGTSLAMIEGGLTAIAIAVAFCWPKLGSSFFIRIEHAFGRLAQKQGLAVIVVGLTAILLRLSILPLVPIPHPFSPDDFSFLLAGDTFASGRLTNPTPVMWEHFESIHIAMKPTYMSMYFPANGFVLAAGKVLFGHPWFGLLCIIGLMCAAICWMLQAWLPSKWALLGGMLSIVHLGLFSYWINTYSGAASTSALGGALVLGAMPRFMKKPRLRYSLLMTVGIILLATSRPYEGILLCVPVTIALGRWVFSGKNKPAMPVLIHCTVVPLALIVAAGAWMGYYDYRAFGNPLTPPYKVDRTTYAVAPYYVWQSLRPEPAYRHEVMRDFYCRYEIYDVGHIQSRIGFLPQTLIKAARAIYFFAGIALLPALIMFRRVIADRRIRFLLFSVLVLSAGMVIEIFLFPHYIAPFTAAFYAIGLQAMRHLRVWRPGGQPVGTALVRLTVTVCCLLGVLRLYAQPLGFRSQKSDTVQTWYGTGEFGAARDQVEADLKRLPGKQLVIVRYSPTHDPMDEWVYNAADIDDAKVIWAREMDEAKNLELIHHYKDRNVWLIQPDLQPTRFSPYPSPGTNTAVPIIAKSEKKVQSGG
jgi:hypothetical protein